MAPSRICTLVTVTVRPMLSSRPVPFLSNPKFAVVYQSVCHGRAEPGTIAYRAPCGLSPSATPSGPKALASCTASCTAGGGFGVALGVGVTAADSVAAGVAAAGVGAAGDDGAGDPSATAGPTVGAA